MSASVEKEIKKHSALAVILWSGGLMTLLCFLVTDLTHGLHPVVISFLNTLSAHQFTDLITALGNGFHYDLPNKLMPLEAFLLIYAILCLLSVAPLTKLKRKNHKPDTKSLIPFILFFSLLFRLILLFSVPIHESDFYRYQWDGKSAVHGINPFLLEPGALKLAEEEITTPYRDPSNGVTWRGRQFDDQEKALLKQLANLRDENRVLHSRVSHQAVPTIYPPVAQAVFSLSSFLFGDSLTGLKSVLLIFDFLIILLSIGILKRLKLNPELAIVYAWSPLVLKEFANSAHYDAVPIFFTLLAIYAALASQQPIKVALSLALGTLAKFFSSILLPVLIPLHPKHWRSYSLFAAVVIFAYLPFFFWNDAGLQQVFAGLGVYNKHWQYNAGLFALIQQAIVFISPITQSNLLPAKIIVAIVLLSVILWQSFRPRETADNPQDLVRRCFIVMAALFILSPTAFPWYYTWVMPFLCIFPKRPWIMLSWLLPLSYINFHNDIAVSRTLFIHIPVLNWIIWGTFALLILSDYIIICKSKSVTPSPHTSSDS